MKALFSSLDAPFTSYYFLFVFIPSHITWLVGSQFLNQGMEARPQQWKPWILTTGLPGNSHYSHLTGIWNWGTKQFFESTAWSKLQIPANPAFYRFNSVHAISIQYLSVDCINYWKKKSWPWTPFLGQRSSMPGCLPVVPSLCSFTWRHQWVRAQFSVKFLAVKEPRSSRMMIYFQLQAGFVNTVINEERPPNRIPLAGPLKWKHTAFQHHLA